MKCENCCYYSYSEMSDYEHCCFNEWGHGDYEIAPCDDKDFDDNFESEEY